MNNASTLSKIETVDVGLDIEITPRINSLNDVTLKLKLGITSITDYTRIISGQAKDSSGKAEPTYNEMPEVGHRIVDNTSNVKNGEVIAIGGLLKNQKIVTRTAPPVLGDLPWIGWLFAKDSEATEQIELMILFHPLLHTILKIPQQ